jgi:hypothetical protein
MQFAEHLSPTQEPPISLKHRKPNLRIFVVRGRQKKRVDCVESLQKGMCFARFLVKCVDQISCSNQSNPNLEYQIEYHFAYRNTDSRWDEQMRSSGNENIASFEIVFQHLAGRLG